MAQTSYVRQRRVLLAYNLETFPGYVADSSDHAPRGTTACSPSRFEILSSTRECRAVWLRAATNLQSGRRVTVVNCLVRMELPAVRDYGCPSSVHRTHGVFISRNDFVVPDRRTYLIW